jgi:hypothetical protein
MKKSMLSTLIYSPEYADLATEKGEIHADLVTATLVSHYNIRLFLAPYIPIENPIVLPVEATALLWI